MNVPLSSGTGRIAQSIRAIERELRRQRVKPGIGLAVNTTPNGTFIKPLAQTLPQANPAPTRYIAVWL